MGKILFRLIIGSVVVLFIMGIGFALGATMIEPENSCVNPNNPAATAPASIFTTDATHG